MAVTVLCVLLCVSWARDDRDYLAAIIAIQPQDPLRQGVDRGALSKLKSSLAVLLSNHRDGPQARHAPNAICAYSIRVHFM